MPGPPTSYVETYQGSSGIPACPTVPLWAEPKLWTGKTGPILGFWGSNLSQVLPGHGYFRRQKVPSAEDSHKEFGQKSSQPTIFLVVMDRRDLMIAINNCVLTRDGVGELSPRRTSDRQLCVDAVSRYIHSFLFLMVIVSLVV